MGKGAIIIVVYSLVLITLFGIFSYLMTTVNPPPLKQDSIRTRKFEAINDEVLYPNEILQPNDNVAYGLEKIDYDSIEVYNKLSNLSEYRRSEVTKNINAPKTNSNKSQKQNTVSNSSKTENKKYKMTTVKRKLAKGFRRSIREKPNVLNNKLLSLLLNIKLFKGQPRIEIKVLDDNNEDKAKDNQNLVHKVKELNISSFEDVRELNENETLLVQVVGNLTNSNETCSLNNLNVSACKEKRESPSELIVEIVNSSETNNSHVLDLPNKSKPDISIMTKSDKFLEIKKKYEINVTSAMTSKYNNLNVSK